MSSFQEEGIQVYFVCENETVEPSDIMNSAITYLQDYIDKKQISWIKETEIQALGLLSKRDIFVLEKFEGTTFEILQKTKALIIGPRCLLSCILDDSSIPFGPSPVFITAMRDISVCISGLKESEKLNFRNLISYMGGTYMKDLRRRDNLYLVSNTIKSTKYEQATLNSIPVMLPEWINAVWEKGQKETILATDPYFDKYKLPIFYAANITTSGISGDIREKIANLVSEHGGNFQRTFKSNQTDILITLRECIDSDKYKAAVKYKKDVLIPDWVFDSVSKGYALPISNYRVNPLKVSTPTKNDNSIPDFTGNFTQLSEISRIDGGNTPSNDISICSNMSVALNKITTNRKPTIQISEINSGNSGSNVNVNKPYKNTLAEISIRQAKKAGNFLDGCYLFLSGFTDEEKDKLNKILGVSGAHHYSEINEKITHVVVGDIIEKDFNILEEKCIGASIVTLNWVLDSIEAKQPILNDIQYRPKMPIRREPETPSPRSKKSLQSLNYSFKKPEAPKKNLFASTSKTNIKNVNPTIEDAEVDGLLSHYSQENNLTAANLKIDIPVAPKKLNNSQVQIKSNNEATLKQPSLIENYDNAIPLAKTTSEVPAHNLNSFQDQITEELSNVNFFDGLAVYVDKDHDQEMYTQIVYDCELALGKIVSDTYIDEVDYAIVSYEEPVEVSKLPVKAKNIVNGLWIDDAIKENALVPIQYFHLPIPISAKNQPLANMVIVVSIYSGSERCFLEELTKIMGATYKDTYMKKDKPLLIIPSAQGQKYNAAIKWGYPAVTSEWLVKCAKLGLKIDMTPYLVGESMLKENSIFLNNISPSKKMKLPNEAEEKLTKVEIDKDALQNDMTPLRHKRVFELGGGKCSTISSPINSEKSSTKTPSAPLSPYVDIFDNLDEYLKTISDPDVRECTKQILLEVKNTETPELERIKKLVRTPGDLNSPASPITFPDFCKTPEFRKRMCDFFEKRKISVEKRKPDTPLSEIKRRLWRETLPAEFLAGLEGFNTPTALSSSKEILDNGTPHVKRICTGKSIMDNFQDNVPSPTASVINKENNEASPGVKRLKDFIKNCEEEKTNSARKSSLVKANPLLIHLPDEETQNVDIPQRFETEMMFNSERMVGWGDNIDYELHKKFKSDGISYKGTPIFNISTTAEFNKTPILDGIKQLKGEICENISTYDPSSTHVVCERPNRGEKLLSSVAAGKWILSINYITDSLKKGYFLKEEFYEWGNPKAINLPSLKSGEQSIANAFHFWHNKISQSKTIKGAFSGFRVILHMTEKSRYSFTNVINAGDGEVLKAVAPYDKSVIKQATHCLVDQKKCPLDKREQEKFVAANVPVISFMFISSYLTNDPNVDISEFILSL